MIVPIRLRLANAFLLRGDRPVLVDTGCPNEAGAIRQALWKEKVDVADLALILHTHAHSDHCGSTGRLKLLTGAPTAIHRGDLDMFRAGVDGHLKPATWIAHLIKPFLSKRFRGSEPDLIIDREMSLEPYGVNGRVLPTPGHTPGSVSVITEAGEAIVGDLLMGGFVGGKVFPRRPRPHYFADDLALERASLTMVLSHAPTVVYVGHGGPLAAEDVRRWLEQEESRS